MHRIYGFMWKSAVKMADNHPFSRKTWYLFLNTVLWCFAGIILYGAITFVSPYEFSVQYFFASAGCPGIIMGFWGGSMYILRNTEPEDLK